MMKTRHARKIKIGLYLARTGAPRHIAKRGIERRAYDRFTYHQYSILWELTGAEYERYNALAWGRGLATANYQGMVDIERAALVRLRAKGVTSDDVHGR